MAVRYPIRNASEAPTQRPVPTREALDVLQGFAAGAQSEIEAGLARGVAFATMVDGNVAWVHPDGTLRSARSADSPVIRR